MRLFI